MAEETIVAVFDTDEQAQGAMRDLQAAGIPSGSIGRVVREDASAAGTRAEPSFWQRLFGAEPDEMDTTAYDSAVGTGGTVVSVRVGTEQADDVIRLLEKHHPADMDERVGSLGQGASSQVGMDSSTSASMSSRDTTIATDTDVTGVPGLGAPISRPSDVGAVQATSQAAMSTPTRRDAVTGSEREEVIPLAAESLQVGKRDVQRGATRVRRYVVERPVEEQIALRSETVEVERRPVSGARGAVGSDAFTERTVTMTETEEQAVVGKTARITEEVVVHKDVHERLETVHDTVRREEVEVVRPEGSEDRPAHLTDRTATERPMPSQRERPLNDPAGSMKPKT